MLARGNNDTPWAWDNHSTSPVVHHYNNNNHSSSQIPTGDSNQDVLNNVEIAVIATMSAIAVVGFQGNLSVAVVIINNPCLRTSMTNLFVLNLVIVDLLACVVAMPLAIMVYSVRNSNHHVQLCEVSGFFSTSFMLCSMLTLCVISMDRFYSIAMPLHHAAHSMPLIAVVVVFLVWLVAILVACLPCLGLNSYKVRGLSRFLHVFLVWFVAILVACLHCLGLNSYKYKVRGLSRFLHVFLVWFVTILVACLPCLGLNSYKYKFKHQGRICSFEWAGDNNDRAFVITIFVVAFLIPSLVILSMYSSIFCIARKAARTVAPQPSEATHSTIVNPEPEMSRTDNPSLHPVEVSTIGATLDRRPRVRIVSLSSTPPNFTDARGCQNGFVISYSSPPNDRVRRNTISNGIIVTNDLAKSSSVPGHSEYGDGISATSATHHKRRSFSTPPQSTYSRSIHCDQEHCKRHMSANIPRGCSCHCTPQVNSQTIPTLPDCTVHNMPPTNTNHITTIHGNNRSLPNCETPTLPETLTTNILTASVVVPHKSTPSFISTQRPSWPPPMTSRPKHSKAFRTVMVIVLSYLLLWGPYFVCQVHQSRGGSVSSSSQLLVSWLGFTSYTVHPFLYGGMNRLIRDELCSLYRTLLMWLQAMAFCLCWSCCRCCSCFNVIKGIFAPKDGDSKKYSAAVMHCMPWLKDEEEESGEEEEEEGDEERNNGNDVSEIPGHGKKRKKKRRGDDGDETNGEDGAESFFQFLQRTQEEDSHVPESFVVDNDVAT